MIRTFDNCHTVSERARPGTREGWGVPLVALSHGWDKTTGKLQDRQTRDMSKD